MTGRCGRSFTDQDFSGLEKIADAGMEKQAVLPLVPIIFGALGALGAGMSVHDAYKSARRGEYGRALGNLGLAAASFIPILGQTAKGAQLLNAAKTGIKGIPAVGKAMGYGSRAIAAAKASKPATWAMAQGGKLMNAGRSAINSATPYIGETGANALRWTGNAAKWTGKNIAAPVVGWNIADNAINGRAYAGAEANANYYVPGYGYQGYGVNGY